MPKNLPPMSFCPICKARVRIDRVNRHRAKQHSSAAQSTDPKVAKSRFIKTPKPKRPKRHHVEAIEPPVRNVHPAVGYFATKTGTMYHQSSCSCLSYSSSCFRITEDVPHPHLLPCSLCLSHITYTARSKSEWEKVEGVGWQRNSALNIRSR